MTRRRTQFEAIGTRWVIDAGTDIDMSDGRWGEVEGRLRERIDRFDATYSRFRSDSWITQLSQNAGTYELPDDAAPLLAFYERLYRATGGLVTPLIGGVMTDSGYDASYTFKSQPLTKPAAWDDVIEMSQGTITVKQSVILDVGAAGKGYLVDIIGELLQGHGVHSFLINAGGDILHRNTHGSPARIGLENPHDRTRALGVVRLGNGSLCASSGSMRAWGPYHHIINPDTLKSPRDVLATWVMAGDTMAADGLATALFLVKPQRLLPEFQFEYAMLKDDMQMQRSRQFPAELFTGATQ